MARAMIFKGARQRCVFFFAVSTILATAAFCGTAVRKDSQGESGHERPEPDKHKVLRQVGLDWIEVGRCQEKRRFFPQAERSFLAAKGYEQYLTGDEHSRLNEHLQKAHRYAVEQEQVLQELKTAAELVRKGRPIKARAHFENIRDSEYLSKQQRKSITEQLKDIDRHFDEQQSEITALYNRSIEYYRAGELEKAREGFLAVTRYGLLVAPAGHRAEDYLAAIDDVLMARLSRLEPSDTVPTNRFEQLTGRQSVEATGTAERKSREGGPTAGGLTVDSTGEKNALEPEQVVSVAAPGEQYVPHTAEQLEQKRATIIHGYTKAVLTDTASKVAKHLTKKEYNQAMEAVKSARTLVRRNRSWLGEELYEQYIGWLGELSEKILSGQSGKKAQ